MRPRRPWLVGLERLYGAGVQLKNWMYDADVLKTRALRWPVISVGSVSAGGAGKTPVVITLAGLLEQNCVAVDVLSRGFGRRSSAAEKVQAAGEAERFGDEPLEMARAGLRVYVGSDRWAAGALAERREPRSQKRDLGHPELSQEWRVHVLDDGFQHRRLRRALDVVLLTAEDAEDRLLPGGNLREPLRNLRRAGVLVVRAEEAERLQPVIAQCPQAEVWMTRRQLVLPERRLSRPLVFCGIARPDGFLRMLAEAGCQTAGQVIFRDHQCYRARDIERILAAGRAARADGFYTTAKDDVKLAPDWRKRLGEVGPVETVSLTVKLEDEARALGTLLRAIQGWQMRK